MNYAGNASYELKKLSLFHKPKGIEQELEIDLSSAFVTLSMYESIFVGTISGSVAIIDSYNLQDILPLYGNERIELEFNTSGSSNIILYSGIIYKISNKNRISEHTSGYILHFISDVAIKSQRLEVNQAYRDTCSNVTKRIFESFGVDKKLEVESTKGIEHFVFGSLSPLEAISLLAKRSYSVSDNCGYYFYEDIEKYNFVSLEYLYQQEPSAQYHYRTKGVYDDVSQRFVEAFSNIQDITVMEENSYLDRLMEGQHGLSSIRFDLFNKQISKLEYNKERFFDRTKSLGDLAYKKEVETSNDDLTIMSYSNDNQFDQQRNVISRMRRVEIETFRAKVIIMGDSSLRVGNTCLCYIPNWNTSQHNLKSMIGEKFLITEIHHMLTQTTYQQTMMIQKESYDIV